jgi:arylformamidase
MNARMVVEPELRLWDISQPLRPDIPVWPGDGPFEERRTVAMGPDCPFNLTRIALSTHTGSHADGPLHYDAGGAPIGEVDPWAYVGPAQLMTVSPCDGRVLAGGVVDRLVPGVRRLLLRTFEAFPMQAWRSDFAGLEPALIDAIADRGCVLIGVDAPSLDPETSKTMDAHAAVARRGLRILEGLVFDGVEDGLYELIAAPLRLANADASPVRALLRELPDRT